MLKSTQLISAIAALAGLLAIVSTFTTHLPRAVHSLAPGGVYHVSRVFPVALGFFLLYLSIQLYKRKAIAFQLALVSSGLLTFFALVQHHSLFKMLVYTLTLVVLLLNRSLFVAKNDNVSFKRGLRVAAFILICTFLYGVVGLFTLDRPDFGPPLTLPDAAKYTLEQMFTAKDFALPHPTREGTLFLRGLDAAALTAGILAFVSLFKPIRFALESSFADREKARELIKRFSTSTEDFFKLWPTDKHYYFSAQGGAFVAYKVSGESALVLDGPTGNSEQFDSLLKGFSEFTVANGWTPAILHGDDAIKKIAADNDYKSVFIGNEALVDCPTFAAKTQSSKHFRYIKNKAAREELSVEHWPPTLNWEQIGRLRTVSDAWLNRPGRREYTFIMGYFDPSYLRECDIFVLRHKGEIVAYSNLIPSFLPHAASVDHIRFTADMPSIGMHYLLMEMILQLQKQGVTKFNLGLSPLSGIEERPDMGLTERFLKSVKTLGGKYYSFEGLEQFKNKFEPSWEPRYIYYRGLPTNLLVVAQNMNKAITIKKSRWAK